MYWLTEPLLFEQLSMCLSHLDQSQKVELPIDVQEPLKLVLPMVLVFMCWPRVTTPLSRDRRAASLK